MEDELLARIQYILSQFDQATIADMSEEELEKLEELLEKLKEEQGEE